MNFSPKIILPFVAAAALVIIGGVYLAGGPDADPTPASAPVTVPAGPADSAPATGGGAAPTTASAPAAATPAGNPGPLLQDKEQIFAVIEEAMVSYDPQELPKIQPYLLHADPEIRQVALESMVNMGEAAAAPMLRAAAKLAVTPQEAVAMNEAADYVELPSATMLGIKTRRPAMLKKKAEAQGK